MKQWYPRNRAWAQEVCFIPINGKRQCHSAKENH